MVDLMDKTQDRHRRIVMFVPQEVHTGGDRYLVEIFKYFQRQKVLVEPIYLVHNTRAKHGLKLAVDCLLTNFRFFYLIRQIDKLSSVIFFEDFYLHPRLWLFNILARLITGRMRTVILVQSTLFYHNILNHRWAKWLDEWVVRIFFRQASLILTNSEFTRQEVLSFGKDPNRVKVIYCGYEDILTPKPKKKQTIREDKDIRRILFVGQCVRVKGIEFLLRAVSMLSDRRIMLNVVGNTTDDSDYFTRLRHTIEALNLEDRVIFHGHISNKMMLVQFYQRADVFVLPSLSEGFGIVLLEAMSFGLPIVATRVGSIPELVRDEENGLLVLPANSESLADALKRLLDSEKLRQRLGTNGRNFYQANRGFYSWDKVGERILASIM